MFLNLRSYRVNIFNNDHAFLLNLNVAFRVVVRAVLLTLRLYSTGLEAISIKATLSHSAFKGLTFNSSAPSLRYGIEI